MVPLSGATYNMGSEIKELRRLLTLLRTNGGKQQLPSIQLDGSASCVGPGKAFQWPVPQPRGGAPHHQSEALELESFGTQHGNLRVFHNHEHHQVFIQIFMELIKQRLCCREWMGECPTENILRVLLCLRIMLRDPVYQQIFFQNDGAYTLADYLQKATDSYLFYGDGYLVLDILKEMTNIFQKLASSKEQRERLLAYNVHRSLVLLLSANDVFVLHCSLHTLTSLAESKSAPALIGELNSIEQLLKILQDYDEASKKVAASLLRLLCSSSHSRELVKAYDGIPLLLSLLHSDNIKLLWHVVWCLVQLAEDQDSSNDIRHMGGIPLLLSLLHDRKFINETAIKETSSAPPHGRPKHHATPSKTQLELIEHILSLKSACCAALTELVLNDTNGQQIVQANGIYAVGRLILPNKTTHGVKRELENLQRNAFRTLRFLFSMERNRRLFQRLFPPLLYEKFIDCGHYVRDLRVYKPLVEMINKLPRDVLDEIRDSVCATDQNKAPSHHIGDYAVMELLGTGAFGCVYKVKKRSATHAHLAMKEIHTAHITKGRSSKERDRSVGDVINELTIIKEQLRHPNVVRYYKTFVENDKLYIVMELIEGAPLGEHFNSLKEKGERFIEDRIWHIFIQIVLALRYLHKEKQIIHRDLSPNNIMLGENDHVTITDFGLAKQKTAECSQMNSFVGTVIYSCPEIMQNNPYGEKADIWSLGCILYQMCALQAPFYSNNLIHLAQSIVQAKYPSLKPGEYSTKMESTIRSCLTPEPDDRPDVVQVAGSLADIILMHLDMAQIHQNMLQKKLEKERKRTQRHFFEANRNMQNYHRLFLISQERQDKLASLASSGGAASLKNGDYSDVSDTESVGSRKSSQTDGKHDSNRHRTTDWSDEDAFSSSASSRASSAGSRTSLELDNTLKAEEQFKENGTAQTTNDVATLADQKSSSKHRRTRRKLDQELCVQIPVTSNGQCNGQVSVCRDSGLSSGDQVPLCRDSGLSSGDQVPVCRDSGLSSGDPSPNPLSTSSTSSSELGAEVGYRRQLSDSSALNNGAKRSSKLRPSSANPAMLTISPRKVRQISDPILQMLHQLHKIIYITQLPPTLCPNPRRRSIEQFKRALFAPQSTSFNLKSELKKLLMGSREPIDLDFGPYESPFLSRQTSSEQEVYMTSQKSGATCLLDVNRRDMDYEQMQAIIESVLVESGYYDVPSCVQSPASPNQRPRYLSDVRR